MNAKLSVGDALLDENLSLRPLRWSDVEQVAQVIYAACVAEGDAIAAQSAEELKHDWQKAAFDLEQDAFVVETSEGRVVGYAELLDELGQCLFVMNGNVHPDFKGRGTGTTLLRAVEKRARAVMQHAEPGLRAAILTTINRNEPDGVALHQNEGYLPIRYHWRMQIDLTEPPPQPSLSPGIEIRPFLQEEHARAVWQAHNESFRDHPGSFEWTFEDWQQHCFNDPEYDPSLWAVAWDGSEVAGYSINRHRMGIGWIRTLGVRRPWRKRGIGEALLLHSFAEYYRRGMRTIGLGVNANNPTGATRLYQKLGMYPASEFVTYEKELCPGRAPEER